MLLVDGEDMVGFRYANYPNFFCLFIYVYAYDHIQELCCTYYMTKALLALYANYFASSGMVRM